MTELMTRDRPRQVIPIVAPASPWSREPVPALQWEVDAETRRPVSRWVLSETGLEHWI